ncbi:MAG: radical SAM protein [Clostridia bacterium]|nr:radical SAM protein [Clostridia bacterium]
MIKGIVTDIQRASVHDGPGLRTTVFFKGCPLHCDWCHNPECIAFPPQILAYPEKCIGCGMCEEGCFSGAKVPCGKEMSTDEVLSQILLDKDYYGNEGGVTFSGGEPFSQPEFLSELIDKSKAEGVHCAVETSLITYHEEILKKLDLVMADLKIWDDDLHKKHTGVSNKIIKEHFIKLNTLGIPIIARTPVIPEIEQGIEEISAFLHSLENVIQYELLPYHPLGESKRVALGQPKTEFTVPSKDYMKELEHYVFVR